MMNDPLSFLFSSASWMRLLIDALLFALIYLTTKNNDVPGGRFLLGIPAVHGARDLISFGLPHQVVFFIGEFVILTLLIWWISTYKPRFINPRFSTIMAAAQVLILSILAIAFPGIVMSVVLNIVTVATAVYLAVSIFNISEYNTRDADFIVRYRQQFIIAYLVSHALLFFLISNTSVFAQWIVYPALSAPYFVLMYGYIRYFNGKFREREEYNTTYTNSLFDFMRTIGSAMTERIEVKAVINYVIKSISHTIQADAGVVYLRDAGENALKVGAWEGHFPPLFEVPTIVKTKITGMQKYFESTPVAMGETVIGECAVNMKPIFIRMTWEDERMKINARDESVLISSIIVAPLIVNKEIFGVVAVTRRNRDNLFNDDDYDRAKIFIEYASITLDSLYSYAQLLEKQEIEREVNIAASIQKKLLPGRLPATLSSQVAAYSIPAKGVSGDYYDIIPLTREGKFAVVICDVAGKGVPASLIMVMIRTIVHTIGGSKKDASEIVKLINRGIAGRVDIERFATLSYMTYDPVINELQYSNAGHHPLMVYRAASNTIERIDSPGLPIGLERDSEYQLVKTTLETGDTVITYTDGIIEAMDYRGEQFEEQRLQEAVLESVFNNPKDIVGHIRTSVEKFVGQAKQHDDMTLIVLKAR
jgi:sigma-B regulation protein RsbU (phosphoserine phosphatase)